VDAGGNRVIVPATNPGWPGVISAPSDTERSPITAPVEPTHSIAPSGNRVVGGIPLPKADLSEKSTIVEAGHPTDTGGVGVVGILHFVSIHG
jgi:hypothetical protein